MMIDVLWNATVYCLVNSYQRLKDCIAFKNSGTQQHSITAQKT
jgi:hypothetical protein